MKSQLNDSKDLWLSVERSLPRHNQLLGVATSNAYLTDPRMLAFICSRYKFVAKMMEGKRNVLEVGCGDAFGSPIVAQTVDKLTCLDIDPDTIAANAERLSHVKNTVFRYHDFRDETYGSPGQIDGVFSIDVLEHIFPSEENAWCQNLFNTLNRDGIAVIGTPNKRAEIFASEHSRTGHVNLKEFEELRELVSKYFNNVLMFGMNDEVLHTGYSKMCHYLFAIGIGPRNI